LLANRVRLFLWLACVCFLTAQPCFAGFRFAGRLVTPRGKHTATLLQDGRVLIAGGTDRGLYNASANAEIYDPSTGNPDGTGRTQFINDLIPASRISPIAARILGYVPAPLLPGLSDPDQ